MKQLEFQFEFLDENWDRLYASYKFAKPRYIDQVRLCMLNYENKKSELETQYRDTLNRIRLNFEERIKLQTVLIPSCRHPQSELMVMTFHGPNETTTVTCTICGKKNP